MFYSIKNLVNPLILFRAGYFKSQSFPIFELLLTATLIIIDNFKNIQLMV